MRRLFISSAGIVPETSGEFRKLAGKDLRNLTVAFIPTAADLVTDKTFVQWSIDQINELGMRLVTVDLKEQNKDTLYNKLSKIDIIWVNGGDTHYLLDKVRESGFDQIIEKLLDEGKIYVGVSAGSYITCPYIKFEENKTGLNLVDFLLVVHYEEKNRDAVEKSAKSAAYPVIALTDQQAIIVNGKGYEIIGTGEQNTWN